MKRRIASLFLAQAMALTSIQAQSSSADPVRLRHGVGAVIGLSQFDLSGTGNALLVGLRGETEFQPWLIGEAALGIFRPEEQFLERATYISPEVQLQIQLPNSMVRPYLGAGIGYWYSNRASQATASTAGGLRFTVPAAPLDLRAELRVRGIGRNFAGSTAEWTAGVTYRF